MVDLGQKGRKKFRLFYWNKVKNHINILQISNLSDLMAFHLKYLSKKRHNNTFELS